jgi:hypothetical protein
MPTNFNDREDDLKSGLYSDGLGDLDEFLREGLDYDPTEFSSVKTEKSPRRANRRGKHSRSARKSRKNVRKQPEEERIAEEYRATKTPETSNPKPEDTTSSERFPMTAAPVHTAMEEGGLSPSVAEEVPDFDYGDYIEEGRSGAHGGRKKHTGWWIALGVVVVLTAAAGIFGYVEMNSDKIFPNVYAEGINLGGMTQKDAETSLQQVIDSKTASDELVKVRVLTVEFSNGSLVRVDLAKAGVKQDGEGQDAAEIALEAYNYGRSGNIFTAFYCYILSAVTPHSLDGSAENAADDARLNKDYIMERIQIGLNRMQVSDAGAYTVNEQAKTLTIVKNPTAYNIDPESVYIVIAQSIQDRTYGQFIPYEINDSECQFDIDWNQIHDEVYRAMVNASYRADTGTVTEAVTGIDFNIDEAQKIWDAAKNGETVVVPLTITEPEVTTEDAEAQMQRLIDRYSSQDDDTNSDWSYDSGSSGSSSSSNSSSSGSSSSSGNSSSSSDSSSSDDSSDNGEESTASSSDVPETTPDTSTSPGDI